MSDPPVRSTRDDALQAAADGARLAPSVHNTQPWIIDLAEDRLVLRAERGRQLAVLDPSGRELLMSLGAALLNARAVLAARGRAVEVSRLPDPSDPDLVATIRVRPGCPDAALARLADAVAQRRTNRRRFQPELLPEADVRTVTRAAAEEDTVVLPVVSAEHRQLVARLTQAADAAQNADPAYRAELRRWTNRTWAEHDGIPVTAVPHVDGAQHDEVPLRDFDTTGAGQLPPETGSGTDQTLLLLTTAGDDPLSWLRCGEATERVLLELTRLGWAAGPLTQAIEVPLTRLQLRSALTWQAHPQMLLRVGRAAPTPPPPRRPRGDVVRSTARTGTPVPSPSGNPAPKPAPAPTGRPVSDGRGGTVWR